MTELAALLPPATTLPTYLLMGALVFVGACLQGVGGIGFAMFAAPIAAWSFPALVPGPLLLLGGLVSVMAALREPAGIQWALTRQCIAGRCVGAALATGVMVALPPRPLAIAFGLSLLLAVALSSVGWVLVPTRRNAVLAGVASGLMGTITSAGAPPLGLLTQRLPPPAIRATVGCIIAIGSMVSLLLLAVAGHFSQAQALLGLALFPWVLAGFRVSSRLARTVSVAGTRRLLLGLVAGSALAVLGKALLT